MKNIDKILTSLEKTDKIISNVFLYCAATCGFLFGWICLGILFISIGGEIPNIFVLSLRIFYFLISFLFGLKSIIFIINFVRKYKK